MVNFSPNNDAETLMERFLWQDYTEGRSGHGRIDGAEYTGYRALLETGGLYLVDIGRGQYDTYLSFEDIQNLFNRGVQRERKVKVHAAQIGTEKKEFTLEELSRRYEVRSAVDQEGNPLQGFSSARMQLLFRPLTDSHFSVATEERNAQERAEESFVKEKKEGPSTHFQSEFEQILALIDEDERNGILTHSQAEQYREKAAQGELILVDVGTGNFDTYLSLDQAKELQDQTAQSTNPNQAIRLYDTTLLGEFGNPSGEIEIKDLDDVFAQRLARGAAPEPEAERPEMEDPEKALQMKQEKEEAAREEAQRLSQQAHQRILPPMAPDVSGGDLGIEKDDIPSSLRERGNLKLEGQGTVQGPTPREQEGMPTIPRGEQRGRSSGSQPAHAAFIGEIPTESPMNFRNPVVPSSSEEQTGSRRTQQTKAAPKKEQSETLRYGPQRYEPESKPKTKKKGASVARWTGAMVGGSAAAGGGITSMVVLRRLGESPELASLLNHLIHPWIDPLTQLFV